MRLTAKIESETSKHSLTRAYGLLGDMLLELNKPIEALRAYEVNLKGNVPTNLDIASRS